MLAEDAIRSAIRDYRSKRAKQQTKGSGVIDITQTATGETVTASRVEQAPLAA